MTLPVLDLHPIDTMRGSSPTLLRDEVMAVIKTAIHDQPRSQQIQIGPSEIGTPCDRKLGYKLAATQVPRSRTPRAAWRPIIGVATHHWLHDVFSALNITTGIDRYLTEFSVDVGEIDGVPIIGSCDIYDRVTCTVLDWKIVGPSTLKAVKGHGPSLTYQNQVQLYGRGMTRRGLPVDTVCIVYLPSNGELYESIFWHTPYDEDVAIAALDRATRIRRAQLSVGADTVNALLPITEDYCLHCPWFVPNSTEANTCPGALGLTVLQKMAGGNAA